MNDNWNNQLYQNNYEQKNPNKKNKTKRNIILFIILTILIVLGVGTYYLLSHKINRFNYESNKEGYLSNIDIEMKDDVIAYIPLDDRPVNTDRVQYLADSIGYKLELPKEEYYKTTIDAASNLTKEEISNPSNTSQTGNPKELANFLIEMEEKGCDYYIISLETLFSGGLMGARYYLNEDFGEENITSAFKALEKILSDKNNHVYMFDAVLRLASSGNYKGWPTDPVYYFSRAYGSLPRKELVENELTIDNIVKNYTNIDQSALSKANYTENKSNGKITSYSITYGGKKYEISSEIFDRLLKERERHLRLFDRYAKLFENKKAYVYYVMGTEDAVPDKNNIQINDIAYIEKTMQKYISDFEVKSGTDEIGMLLLTRMVTDKIEEPIGLNVKYYGNSEGNPSSYDTISTKETISQIFDTINAKDVDLNDTLVQVLVFAYDNSKSVEENEKLYYEMINQYIDNINKGKLTIIIDSKEKINSSFPDVYNEFLEHAPLGYLIGYSRWNTFTNSAGIALSQGVLRYLNLMSDQNDDTKDIAHLKSITFDFIKDWSYQYYGKKNVKTPTVVELNKIMNDNEYTHINAILNNLNNSNFVYKVEDNNNLLSHGISDIKISNFTYPWGRDFEIRFDIKVNIKQQTNDMIMNVIYDSKKTDDDTKSSKESEKKAQSSDKDDSTNDNGNNKDSSAKKYTKSVTHYSYISLNSDGSFDYNGKITRAEYTKWLCLANNISPVTKYESLYSDVNTSTENWQYILAATKAGYVVGNNNSKFRPTDYITRAETITGILNMININKTKITKTCSPEMKDVPSDKWYYTYIKQAADYCILIGNNNGEFKPTANITKAELSAIIYRSQLREEEDGWDCDLDEKNPFSNITPSNWSYTYLHDAYKTHTCRK